MGGAEQRRRMESLGKRAREIESQMTITLLTSVRQDLSIIASLGNGIRSVIGCFDPDPASLGPVPVSHWPR